MAAAEDFRVDSTNDRAGHKLKVGDLIYYAMDHRVDIGRIVEIDLYLGIEIEAILNTVHPATVLRDGEDIFHLSSDYKNMNLDYIANLLMPKRTKP